MSSRPLGAIRRTQISNKQKITDFFSQISAAQNDAESLEKPFFTRIILISLLDALSRCAHPSTRGNRARFVTLIDDYAQWGLSSTYSLRQLALRLADASNPSAYPGHQALSQDIQSRMQSWPAPGAIVFPGDVDPSATDIGALLSKQLMQFIEPVRYPSLLWKLRNFVIHEVRHPGEGVDFQLGIPSPYYHHLTHADGIAQTWELYFPNELISHLLTSCASNLSARLTRDDIDPWLAFPYTVKWY